jgi:hypothetical protein
MGALYDTVPSTWAMMEADARDDAALKTGSPEALFPDTNPYTLAQAMDAAFRGH